MRISIGRILSYLGFAHAVLFLLGAILAIGNIAIFNGGKLACIGLMGIGVFYALLFARPFKSWKRKSLLILGLFTYIGSYSLYFFPDFLIHFWNVLTCGMLVVLFHGFVYWMKLEQKTVRIGQLVLAFMILPILFKLSSPIIWYTCLAIYLGYLIYVLFSFLKTQK